MNVSMNIEGVCMRLKTILKNIGYFLLNITGISLFLSCIFEEIPIEPSMYGMPIRNSYTVTGKVFGDIDKDGTTEVIPNIEIKICKKNPESNEEDYYECTTTDDEGAFSVTYYDDYQISNEYSVTFSDVDDDENGSFLDKSMEVGFTSEDLEEDYSVNQHFIKDIGRIELSNK